MSAARRIIPSFRWNSLVVVGLSYSIGWGIRGNFGHEFGAMLAGALAGIAISLFSGREDWRARMPYFAFYGAAGCAFGGSIAYMPVMAYMQADGRSNQLYGFFTTFLVGALWTGLGGVGMAYAASEDRETLTATFKPFCWILVLWTAQYFGEDAFARWYELHMHGLNADTSYFRQRGALYWLDSEWVEATLALVALCAFDLWDRRFKKFGLLVAFATVGCALGWGLQFVLTQTGLLQPFLNMVVHTQGDLTAINPATGKLYDASDMISNWPILFYDFAAFVGAVLGSIVGTSFYFYKFGEWRSGSNLLFYVMVGSYLCFLLCPVLLSNLPFFKAYGGFRMMPPRGDSWANTVGAMVGALVYMVRYGHMPVVLAGTVSFFLGGISLVLATCAKVFVYIPGSPGRAEDQSTIDAWAHWRSANWHSLLTEQLVGFLYGLSVAIALGLLASRLRSYRGEQRVRKWTEGFVVFFLLNVLLYVNLVKCIEAVWTVERAGGFRSVALRMKAPLFESIELSSWAWFSLVFLAISACTVALLVRHFRKPLAIIPKTWLGKGQLLYLIFLWAIVLGNFMRILPNFTEKRLATEGVLMLNGLVVTFLLLCCAQDTDDVPIQEPKSYARLIKSWSIAGTLVFLIISGLFETIHWSIYGFNDHTTRNGGEHNKRFGPDADWIVKPIVKSLEHR